MDTRFVEILVNHVEIEVVFEKIKDFSVKNSIISCSDIEDRNGHHLLSFDNSVYHEDENGEIILTMFDITYDNDEELSQAYDVLDLVDIADYTPYVSYMTIDGKDVDPKEYLRVKKLSV